MLGKCETKCSFRSKIGQAQVLVTFQDPSMELEQVEDAAQARLTVVVATVDFIQSDALDIKLKTASTIDISSSISANSTQPVFVVLGIEYYQTVNGELYIINNKECKSLAMVTILIQNELLWLLFVSLIRCPTCREKNQERRCTLHSVHKRIKNNILFMTKTERLIKSVGNLIA